MKKRKLLFIPALFAALAVLGGCYTLHFHDQSSPWQHDETNHWQVCSKCGKEFNKEEHSFDNYTHDCGVCGYHDPVVLMDKDKVMTRLTDHGKKLEGEIREDEHNDFGKVEYIGNYAFKGTKASKIILPKKCEGFYENAFDGLTREQVTTEEEEEGKPQPDWYYYNGVYYKANWFDVCQAMINGNLYPTLKEAIESITEDDVTVTILRDLDLKDYDPIEVSHRITLEPFEGEVKLTNTKFNILSSGSLKILSTVHYESGVTELHVSPAREQYGSTMLDSYTSGSLIYHKLTSKPYESVSVHYINPDISPQPVNPTIARGTHQVYRDALIIDTDCFAYGVFKFNKEYNTIMGLTDFGSTINKLTIAPPTEAGDNVVICSDCFHRHAEENLEITILGQKKTIKVHGEFQKGAFRHVIIDKGVEEIGPGAFVTSFEEGHMDPALREAIAVVMCPLQTLVISNDVNTIGHDAFKSCGSLGNVVIGNPLEGTGSKLQSIGSNAFKDCFNLTSVDFSSATGIQQIYENAFAGCQRLVDVKMPKEGWFTDKGHGFPESEMGSGQAAFKLVNSYSNEYWQRYVHQNANRCYAFEPRERDAQGYHNKTKYFDTIEEYLRKESEISKDGVYFQITDRYPEDERTKTNFTIPKGRSIYLDCDEGVNFTINNLTVEAGAFIFIGENVTLTGDVKLKHNDESGETGSIAFFDPKKAKSVDIQFETLNVHARQSSSKVFNYRSNKPETCVSYGVCNFKYAISNDTEENLISVSNLGKEMMELEVNDQIAFDKPKDLYIHHHFAAGDENLETIVFGKTVKSINVEGGPASDTNQEAFHSCINLTDVIFEKDSSIETIGRGAFYNCIKLVNIDLPNCTKLQHIGDCCFQNCAKLESVKLYSKDLIYIGKKAFTGTSFSSFDVGPNKTGWKPEGSGEIDLTDPTNAAHLFKDKPYCEKVWWRK